MESPKDFLDEISGPFVPPPDLEPGILTIRTEMPKLLKFMIEKLNQDQLDRLIDFSFTMYNRQSKRKYKNNHPEEFRRWGGIPTGKQLRLLRFAARLLEK